MPLAIATRQRQRGNALIEFLMATVFLIFPLLFGTFIFGMRLVRANQVSEVCRDAGHMYAYGVDFSTGNGQNILVRLAQGLNMTATGGNGVLILSKVMSVGASDCVAGGYSSGGCNNLNKIVFTQRVVVGNPLLTINSQLQQSAFGTPSPGIVLSNGNINASDYVSDPSAIATGFYDVIPLTTDQTAYIAEAFFRSPDFGLLSPGGIAARSIF